MFERKTWAVLLIVLVVAFVGATGCTDSDDLDKLASTDPGKKSGTGLFGPKKFIYSENFTLVGETESAGWASFTYDLKGGKLNIDLPKDGGVYYSVDVTTHDPESAVILRYGYNYTYRYREDKFSDFITKKSGECIPINAYLGSADKVHDIQNSIFYIRPADDSRISLPGTDIGSSEPGLDAELIDRNFYLILEIDEAKPRLYTSEFDIGDIIKANGHITIKEISEEEAMAEIERQGRLFYTAVG